MSEINQTGKLAISFSGGRTSALMTKLLIEKYPKREILITFANTGVEHEDTLRFVNDCDKYLFNNKVNWIEAVVNQQHGKGVSFKVTNYDEASRKGEPYRAAVEKYGLFNVIVKSCTSRLKVDPMEKFLKTKGYFRGKKLNYDTAIGIRSDEVDRISQKRKEFRLIYPLVSWGITKEMVLEECEKWDFDLKIPEHFGNCVGCFKKTIRKLATVSIQDPKQFDFWREIEEQYKDHKATQAASDPKTGHRRIYRKHRTVDDIFEVGKKKDFKPYRPKMKIQQMGLFDELDMGGGCGESCEVYSDENLK